jgi:NADH-quinone oxidoreductase subunit D
VHVAPGAGVHRIVDVPALPGDIALGPDHPTLDGLPTVSLDVHGGVVTSAEWIPGTVHRGAEKLFESRDYRQILMLVDRHDWLSAFCSEIGVVVAVERALGLTPPERAQHIRILLCELTRIAHHLAFLAPMPGDLPESWRARAWGWRAEILDLIEAATGHRVHPMFCQVGGVRADVDAQWVQRVARAAEAWVATDPAAALASLDGPELSAVLDARYAEVAVLGTEQALGFGASGPVARASGVDLDLRRG